MPWAISFDHFMPEYTPTVRCAKLLPTIAVPGQNCRKCRVAHSKFRASIEKLRYEVMLRYAALNSMGEGLSMRLVTQSGPVWRGNAVWPNLGNAKVHIQY